MSTFLSIQANNGAEPSCEDKSAHLIRVRKDEFPEKVTTADLPSMRPALPGGMAPMTDAKYTNPVPDGVRPAERIWILPFSPRGSFSLMNRWRIRLPSSQAKHCISHEVMNHPQRIFPTSQRHVRMTGED